MRPMDRADQCPQLGVERTQPDVAFGPFMTLSSRSAPLHPLTINVVA
jgi:hypothetical protein